MATKQTDEYMTAEEQEAALEAREEQKRKNREREASDMVWLMEHKEGRRIMARLLDKAGVYKTTFRPNSEMPFLEGMRNMGLIFITDVMELCPEKYVLMLNEQKELNEHERSSN